MVLGPRLLPMLMACLLAACGAGTGSDLSRVDGPLPRLDPAPSGLVTGTVAHLPKAWRLYSRPLALFGVPVLMAAAGSEWTVTGYWEPPAAIPGRQGWLLDRIWYRLAGDVLPWGRVHVWGQMPDDWIHGDPVPPVEPAAGTPWSTIPYSTGRVVEPVGDREMQLRTCPEPVCPVLARPEADHLGARHGHPGGHGRAGLAAGSGRRSFGRPRMRPACASPWPCACGGPVRRGSAGAVASLW